MHQRLTAPVPPAKVNLFEEVRADFCAILAQQRYLDDRVANLSDAYALAQVATTHEFHISEGVSILRARVVRAFPDGVPKSRLLANMIADAEDAAEAHRSKVMQAREALDVAAGKRTEEIALRLQPRHRAAVAMVASAVRQLSVAIEMERAIRIELAETAPQARSLLLPDMTTVLGIGALSDRTSLARQWMTAVGES